MKDTEKILQQVLVILSIILIATVIGFAVLAICLVWAEDDTLIKKWFLTDTIVFGFTLISGMVIHSLLKDY